MEYKITYTVTYTFTEEEVEELGGIEEVVQEVIDQDSSEHSEVENWEVDYQ